MQRRKLTTIYAQVRKFSKTSRLLENYACKLLVVGGGAGGCTIANKFAKQQSMNQNDVIIVEPSDSHFYQPMFTLVGAGLKPLSAAVKAEEKVVSKRARFLKERAVHFDPQKCEVSTEKGTRIKYDLLLIAVGLHLDFNAIPELTEALDNPKSGVCSNYSHKYVKRTYETLRKFSKGNAIFTFPDSPVKCPGAPQKAAYLSEDFLRKHQKRKDANVIYNTSLPVLFGVKKYADALWQVVEDRQIDVNLRSNLIKIDSNRKIATFQNLDKLEEVSEIDYQMLHVTPPMRTPDVLQSSPSITNDKGFVDVNKDTLQSTKFPNIFAIGDCASSPNSKTAAAVAAQSGVIYKNMNAVFNGKEPREIYNGYASCPLVTAPGKCILAEFDYALQPLETFPFNQAKERYSMYFMKKNIMPEVYWMMLKGYWPGPKQMRKMLRFGLN